MAVDNDIREHNWLLLFISWIQMKRGTEIGTMIGFQNWFTLYLESMDKRCRISFRVLQPYTVWQIRQSCTVLFNWPWCINFITGYRLTGCMQV